MYEKNKEEIGQHFPSKQIGYEMLVQTYNNSHLCKQITIIPTMFNM